MQHTGSPHLGDGHMSQSENMPHTKSKSHSPFLVAIFVSPDSIVLRPSLTGTSVPSQAGQGRVGKFIDVHDCSKDSGLII